MSASALIYKSRSVHELDDLSTLDSVLSDQTALLWLDLAKPDEQDLALLRDEFIFHPLAIEDVQTSEMRAKLDTYDRYSLLVLFHLELNSNSEVSANELKMFIGSNFIVTVHDEPMHCLAELRKRWFDEPTLVEPHPLSLLLHQIADGLVDDYFPVVDAFDDCLSALEERLFDSSSREALDSIFTLRKQLITARRLVAQMRDVTNILSRREQPFFDEGTVPYFTDVYDHILRVSDTLEMQRDLVTGALESYLSIQSNELNQTVRTLTAVTVMIMVPTLIAGIYGMNFRLMPELEWPWGYPAALGLMLFSAAALWLLFRRVRWL